MRTGASSSDRSGCAIDKGSAKAGGTAEAMDVEASRGGTTTGVAAAKEGVATLDWVWGRAGDGGPLKIGGGSGQR